MREAVNSNRFYQDYKVDINVFSKYILYLMKMCVCRMILNTQMNDHFTLLKKMPIKMENCALT